MDPAAEPAPAEPTCPDCGQAMPADVLSGLCPACLLREGAAGETGPEVPFTPPSAEELAELFPQLEILGLIGAGGMGAVYKARQRELDRMVALKILPPGIGDRPGFAGRFTREARALAKLSHPGIVTIHDTGRVNGLYYLLMEFVDGLNLRQLIERGRVAPREALAIVPMICDALQYAHDAGIVHRDIKPENILLDRQGRVKVADFGLAKLVGTGELELARTTTTQSFATQAGQLMGTPQYMAPEQLERPGEVDHRADIYSLGVVLYQMLTGELPGSQLEPPSSKVQLDVRLDEVVLRALERNPDHRYQKVSQVKHSVETLLTPLPFQPSETIPSMEIRFECPNCRQTLSCDESAAGSQVSCPTCAQTMLVPSPAAAPPPQRPGQRPLPSTRPAPGVQSNTATQARGLAIWAFVLALIGLVPVLGLATGAVGLLLGIIALAKNTTSRGLAITATVIGAVTVLAAPLHIGLLNTSLSAARFATSSMVCANNLNAIGEAIGTYRQRNNGMNPPNLETLVTEGLISERILKCPLHEEGNGYHYAGAGTQAGGLLVWDHVPHRSIGDAVVGRTVLSGDLLVSFMPEPQFQAARRSGGGVAPTAPRQDRAVTQGPDRVTPPVVQRRPPAPEPEPMTVERALSQLDSLPLQEKRNMLGFLTRQDVDATQREAVIAAVKPLLNDVDHGHQAFDVFKHWAGPDEVPDLVEMIRVSANSARGKEAMRILARMGDARAAEPLADALASIHTYRDAQAALAALGDIAKPAVLPHFHHEDGRAREAARELLRGYGATDAEILATSMDALGSDSPGTLWSTIEYLATAELTPGQQRQAALGIRPHATSEDRRVVRSAREAMNKLATPDDADFLLELLRSDDLATREFAVGLLIRFKDGRAAQPLAAFLPDPRETYRAGNHLIALGSIAEPAVIPYLQYQDPLGRKRAAEVLADIGTSACVRALEANLRDNDFFAKAAAESALASVRARIAAGDRR